MSTAELTRWSDAGIETGGHTRTHPDLRMLTADALREEVQGRYTTCFAYPFGEYNPEVRAVVAEDYPLAFTCDEGLNDLWTDPHLLKRTNIEPGDTMLDFRLRVWLGWSPLHVLRSRLRPRSRARWVLRKPGLRK